MLANVASEPFTLIMGLHMNNVAWKILIDSGLIYGPFIIMFARNFLIAKVAGEHRGPTGDTMLSYIESDLYKMAAVLLFCLVPIAPATKTSGVNFISYSCSANQLITGNDLQDTSVIGGVTELTPKIPVWWWLVHEVSTYVTNAMIANTPCAEDTRLAEIAFNAEKLEDPQSQMFANEFYKQCFSPAMNAVVRSNAAVDEKEDLWAGSEKAKAEYRKETSYMEIDKDYWVSKTGDTASLDEERGSGAYPNCDAAFNHLNTIAKEEANNIWEEKIWITKLFGNKEEMKDELIKKIMHGATPGATGLFTDKASNSTLGIGSAQFGDRVSGFVDGFIATGADIKNIGGTADAIAYRLAIPHLVSGIQMVLLAIIPVVIIVGGINIKTVGALSGWYFAVEFTLAIQELAYWFDNMMTNVIANNTGIFGPQSSAESSVMRILANFSYQVFPLIWLMLASLLGAVGVNSAMGGAAGAVSGSVGAVGRVATMAGTAGRGGAGAARGLGRTAAKR